MSPVAWTTFLPILVGLLQRLFVIELLANTRQTDDVAL